MPPCMNASHDASNGLVDIARCPYFTSRDGVSMFWSRVGWRQLVEAVPLSYVDLHLAVSCTFSRTSGFFALRSIWCCTALATNTTAPSFSKVSNGPHEALVLPLQLSHCFRPTSVRASVLFMPGQAADHDLPSGMVEKYQVHS